MLDMNIQHMVKINYRGLSHGERRVWGKKVRPFFPFPCFPPSSCRLES